MAPAFVRNPFHHTAHQCDDRFRFRHNSYNYSIHIAIDYGGDSADDGLAEVDDDDCFGPCYPCSGVDRTARRLYHMHAFYREMRFVLFVDA